MIDSLIGVHWSYLFNLHLYAHLTYCGGRKIRTAYGPVSAA